MTHYIRRKSWHAISDVPSGEHWLAEDQCLHWCISHLNPSPLLHRYPVLSNPPSLSWVFPRQPSLSLAGPVGPVNRIGVKKFFSSCPRIFGSAALTTVLFTPKFSDRSWWYAPARACRWKLCRWAQIQWQHPPSLGPSFQLSIWTICSWQQIPGSRLYVRPFDFELRTPSTVDVV